MALKDFVTDMLVRLFGTRNMENVVGQIVMHLMLKQYFVENLFCNVESV